MKKKYPKIRKEDLSWVPWYVIDWLKFKYKLKIENIIKNKKEIFEDTVWSSKTYAIISNNAIVHINSNTWEFITSHPIKQITI